MPLIKYTVLVCAVVALGCSDRTQAPGPPDEPVGSVQQMAVSLDGYASADDMADGSHLQMGGTSSRFCTGIVGGNVPAPATRYGLIQFDVSSIPPYATITAATVTLYNNSCNVCGNTDSIELHRVTSAWTEGGSTPAGGVCTGLTTTSGSLSYIAGHTTTSVDGTVGAFDWSSAQLIADVQAWVSGTANHGWAVVNASATAKRLKQFSTLEDGTLTHHPHLSVTYTLKANGAACSPGQCESGNCVDGVCCDTACGGGATDDCYQCNRAGHVGTCYFAVSSTVCRASGGVCDTQETCTGGSYTCPTDTKLSGNTCRAAATSCDKAETCDGVGVDCPADAKMPATTVCRTAAGTCDVDDKCDGTTNTCGADAKVPSGTVCRGAADVCDAQETCDGSSPTCPADAKMPNTTVCRAAGGVCDAAEKCDGSSNACPVDAKLTSVCRGAADVCDAAESCDGAGNDCPADLKKPNTTVCRAAGGVCDVAEKCTGNLDACPADAKLTTQCRGAVDVCDAAETCDGAGNDCPADAKKPNTTVCRAAGGVCDAVEKCTGSLDACPADAKLTSVCRGAAGVCDAAESCDGSGNDCPADLKKPNTTVCRAAAAYMRRRRELHRIVGQLPDRSVQALDRRVPRGQLLGRAAAFGRDLAGVLHRLGGRMSGDADAELRTQHLQRHAMRRLRQRRRMQRHRLLFRGRVQAQGDQRHGLLRSQRLPERQLRGPRVLQHSVRRWRQRLPVLQPGGLEGHVHAATQHHRLPWRGRRVRRRGELHGLERDLPGRREEAQYDGVPRRSRRMRCRRALHGHHGRLSRRCQATHDERLSRVGRGV